MAVRFTNETQTYEREVNLGVQSEYTLTCWVKLYSDRDYWNTMWCLANPDLGDHFSLLQTDTTGTQVVFITSTQYMEIPIVDMQIDTWYYIGISMSGETGVAVWRAENDENFYIVPITNQGPINHKLFQIGKSIYGGEWLDGAITGVKWWSAALTGTELIAEAAQLAPVRNEDIRAYYLLTVPSTADDSGNGFDLTGGTGATEVPGPDVPVFFGPKYRVRGWGVIPIA